MLLFSNVVSCTGTSDIYSKLIYFSGDTSSNRSVDYVCYFFDDEMSWSWYQTIEQMGWRINRNLLKSKAQIKQIILKLIIELNLGEYSKTLKNAPFSFLADFIVVFTNLCFRELLNTTFLQNLWILVASNQCLQFAQWPQSYLFRMLVLNIRTLLSQFDVSSGFSLRLELLSREWPWVATSISSAF